MAQPMASEIMYKKEGKLGMTTLSFRSKQYTFPSLIVKPDMCSSDDPNAEGMCVLLDVGLLCPFCTGTFSAKFVRSHARLAISQTPTFDMASGEAQAIEGVAAQQPLEGSVHPEHPQCCFTHAGTQTQHSHPESDPDSDLELRRSVESELEGSGIHVHISPNRPGVKPRVANVVPLGRQMGQQSQHGHPQQQVPPMLYPRRSQGEPRPRAPIPREGSSIYVQEKSSHFIVKHDVTKKHPQQAPRKFPPTIAPRTRPLGEQKGTSPPTPQSRPTRQQDRRSRGPQIANSKTKRVSAARRKRGSSVERQEIVYEGENIASGGYLETNLDDFSQSIKAEKEGQHRRMPASAVSNGEGSGHSSDYGSMDSPRRKGDHRRTPESEEPTGVSKRADEPKQQVVPPVVTRSEESPPSVKSTQHESLERPSTSRYGKGMDWASDYDIRHPNHPMNRLRNVQPPSKRTIQSNAVSAIHASHSPSEETGRAPQFRPRTVSDTTEDIRFANDRDVDPQDPPETTVKEILEEAAKYIKADASEKQRQSTFERNETEIVQIRTEETISDYSGEQPETKPDTEDSVEQVLQKPVEQSISTENVEGPMSVPEQVNLKSSENTEVQCVVQQVSEEEMDITSESVFRVVEGAEATYAPESSSDESDTGSEVVSEVFHPEETVDEILESVETETYSPNSTLSRAFTGPRRKRKKKAKRHGRPPAKAPKELTDYEVSQINDTFPESATQETELKQIERPQDPRKGKVPQQVESKELYAAISRIVEKNSKPESTGKSELHQVVSRVIVSEMRTPSPETMLEEILEGVGTDEETVPDSPNYDKKHSKTTMANMDFQTNTTFSSVELQQSIMLQESEPEHKKVITSRSSSRNSLQTTLTSLQALQTEAHVSPSSSCECLPEDAADTGSMERSVSSYNGTSENSADDDVRDSESSEFHASNVGAGSETSIERIIDRTLYLTDKIIAAYPELGQSDEKDVDHDAVLASVATQSSFSDSDDVIDAQEDIKHAHENLLHISTDSGSSSLGREEPYQGERETQTPGVSAVEQPGEDVITGESNDPDESLNDSKEENADSFKEVFDSELSLVADPEISETDFHFSEAYSPPSAMVKFPTETWTSAPAAETTEQWSDIQPDAEAGSREEDPQVRSMILDRVTKDLYNIQHSLTLDGEKWLMEDFYQDAEMTELESMSSQGTLEKNRLSTEIQFPPEALEQTTRDSLDDVNNSSLRMVPRKVQFWVPDRNEEVVDQDPETIEAFETVERSLKEVEQAMKEMAGLSPSTDDEMQEVPSQTDLREVTDDQYNSEHTIEDVDQLESSCNEDFGSEFEDVIEAVVDEQLKDDESAEAKSPVCTQKLTTDMGFIGNIAVRDEKEPETQIVPKHYVSPIQSSSSESLSEEGEEVVEVPIGRTCEDLIREVRVENAQAETFVQDIVRQDSVQRSELCITYVNIDGSSSSETVSDAVTEESDGSVINMHVKAWTPERRLEGRVESPSDVTYETGLGFENNTFLEDEPDTVETLPKQRSLSDGDGDDEDEDDIETMRKIETLSLSLSSSSESDSESSASDDSYHKINSSQEYSAPEVIGVVQTISSQRHDTPEKNSDTAPVADDGKPLVDEEHNLNRYRTVATFSLKEKETNKPEKELTHIGTFTEDLDHSTETSACSDIHYDEPRDHHHQPPSENLETPPGSWEEVLAESTTNVASFETEDVLSKEQAQEFLRQMFGTSQKDAHDQDNKKLDVCTAVVPAGEDGEVTSEEVSTQEVTLVFAWPKKPDEVIRKYEDPYREIHLHRVTKVKDFDIEVVEGPTVTTIERPSVPAITLEKQEGEDLSKKLPAGKDAIVVHQKRKDTVTKRKKQSKPEQDTVGMMTEKTTEKGNLAAYSKVEDDEGNGCDHSKSSDMEVDLDELLADTSDVSETFSVGDDWSNDYEYLPDPGD